MTRQHWINDLDLPGPNGEPRGPRRIHCVIAADVDDHSSPRFRGAWRGIIAIGGVRARAGWHSGKITTGQFYSCGPTMWFSDN